MSRLTVGSIEGLESVQIGGENVTPYTGRRNLLYNGAMQIAQRGTSTSSIAVAPGNYYTADRWLTRNNPQIGVWTQSIESDAPSGSGFVKSLKMLCTTAESSPSATDLLALQQRIEGQDLQHVKKGTSNAESLAVTFWVKSNVTGTFIASIEDPNTPRYYSKSYTISVADTWEKKTIVFPPDTTGTVPNNTSPGLNLWLMLAAGGDYTSGSPNTAWAGFVAGDFAAGQTNLASAVNNYWQVTGVQLEVGDNATPFEYRSFGEELALCQRYYEKSYDVGTAPGAATDSGFILAMPGGAQASSSGIHDAYILFRTTKRANATVSIYDNAGNINKCRRTTVGVANYDNQSVADVNGYTNGVYFRSSSGSAATHTVSCHFTASAEL